MLLELGPLQVHRSRGEALEYRHRGHVGLAAAGAGLRDQAELEQWVVDQQGPHRGDDVLVLDERLQGPSVLGQVPAGLGRVPCLLGEHPRDPVDGHAEARSPGGRDHRDSVKLALLQARPDGRKRPVEADLADPGPVDEEQRATHRYPPHPSPIGQR
jgi:hypothetical protein